MNGEREQSLDQMRIDWIASKAADVPAPAHQFRELFLKRRVETRRPFFDFDRHLVSSADGTNEGAGPAGSRQHPSTGAGGCYPGGDAPPSGFGLALRLEIPAVARHGKAERKIDQCHEHIDLDAERLPGRIDDG